MGILQKVLSSGAGKLIKDVGGVIDNLTTTKEEKLAAEQKIKELISNHELELQKQVTNRWEADMKSDNWLSKNIRPLICIFLTIMFIIISIFDGNLGEFVISPTQSSVIAFEVEQKWTDLLQLVLITVIGAYFGGRSLEKTKK